MLFLKLIEKKKHFFRNFTSDLIWYNKLGKEYAGHHPLLWSNETITFNLPSSNLWNYML